MGSSWGWEVFRNPLRVLVVLTVLAAVVETVAVVGWLRWRAVGETARADPNTAARLLEAGGVLDLPSAVAWSRRLTASDLRGADPEAARAAFLEVGSRQRSWMVTDPEGFKNLSRAAFLSGDVETAIVQLDQALARDPTSAYLHRLMALMLRRAGRSQECLGHLAEATAIAPTLKVPAIDLTEEEVERVRLQSLVRRASLCAHGRVEALINLAAEYRRRGEMEHALEALKSVEEHPQVLVWRAEAALRDGDPEAALDLAGKVTARRRYTSKLRTQALALVARARETLGDREGALSAAQQAAELDPDSPWPFLSLALIAQRSGDWEGAAGHLRRAWGIAPTDVGIALRLAAASERAGHYADARFALERAAELEVDDPRIPARFVEFLLRRGQYMDATLELSRFLDRFPTDPTLLQQAERLRREVTSGLPPE